jgi:hypothetical protein
MGLHTENDFEFDDNNFFDFSKEENKQEKVAHQREVRKKLEERLERKRLKEEIDELDGEFDWDDLYK